MGGESGSLPLLYQQRCFSMSLDCISFRKDVNLMHRSTKHRKIQCRLWKEHKYAPSAVSSLLLRGRVRPLRTCRKAVRRGTASDPESVPSLPPDRGPGNRVPQFAVSLRARIQPTTKSCVEQIEFDGERPAAFERLGKLMSWIFEGGPRGQVLRWRQAQSSQAAQRF
jgi:hypothetical protein